MTKKEKNERKGYREIPLNLGETPDFLVDPLEKIESWIAEAHFLGKNLKKELIKKIRQARKEN